MSDDVTIRTIPTTALPGGGQRYSGLLWLGEDLGARMVLDVNSSSISPIVATAAMVRPEAEDMGLGRGALERILGRRIVPGDPLSPEWFSRLIAHPSTAAILATTSALPARRLSAISFANKIAQSLPDAMARRWASDLADRKNPPALQELFNAVAAEASADLQKNGWQVRITGEDLARAVAHRRIWTTTSPHSREVTNAVAKMMAPIRNAGDAEEALSLHLSAIQAKGIPCSCQSQVVDPRPSGWLPPPPPAAPIRTTGCACKLQSARRAVA